MGQAKAVAGVSAADELEEVAQRFERWRLARWRGEHIPRELWAQAVSLGVRYGVHRMAASLGLNAERLQRRVRDDDGAATETPEPAAATDFVELMVGLGRRRGRGCADAVRHAACHDAHRLLRQSWALAQSSLLGFAGLCSVLRRDSRLRFGGDVEYFHAKRLIGGLPVSELLLDSCLSGSR